MHVEGEVLQDARVLLPHTLTQCVCVSVWDVGYSDGLRYGPGDEPPPEPSPLHRLRAVHACVDSWPCAMRDNKQVAAVVAQSALQQMC